MRLAPVSRARFHGRMQILLRSHYARSGTALCAFRGRCDGRAARVMMHLRPLAACGDSGAWLAATAAPRRVNCASVDDCCRRIDSCRQSACTHAFEHPYELSIEHGSSLDSGGQHIPQQCRLTCCCSDSGDGLWKCDECSGGCSSSGIGCSGVRSAACELHADMVGGRVTCAMCGGWSGA